ncbi:MAG: hypothetical protein AAFR63_01015 [Cyanobacteria bacterium J06631_6]
MYKTKVFDYLELLSSEDFGVCEPREIINLPDFTIVADNVFNEPDHPLTFLVRKIYAKSSILQDRGVCLFDYQKTPTTGVWNNNTLILYQENDVEYLRIIYFTEYLKKSKLYHQVVETSLDGNMWERRAQGKYGWV